MNGQPVTTTSGSINAGESSARPVFGPEALEWVNERNRRHQATFAGQRSRWIRRNRYYYSCMKRLLQCLVEPGKRVLNIRCQTGHFLEALEPSRGVGVEIRS